MPSYNPRVRDPVEELRLVDSNIRNSPRRPLRKWQCESCQRILLYPINAPKPQCPHCINSKGLLVPMRRYY